MPIKVAINGYGSIGRNKMRAVHEYGWKERIEIETINKKYKKAGLICQGWGFLK